MRVALLVLDECDAAGRFRRSQAAICAGLSLSRATVVRAFAVLRSLGFLRMVYAGRHSVPVAFVQFADWIAGGVSRLLAPVLKGFRRMTLRRVLKPEHGSHVDRKKEEALTKGRPGLALFRSMTDELGPLRAEDFIPYGASPAKGSFW